MLKLPRELIARFAPEGSVLAIVVPAEDHSHQTQAAGRTSDILALKA